MTLTGHELNDAGGSLSWEALGAFLRHPTPGTALFRELDPEMDDWGTLIKTNSILADICDQLQLVNTNLTVIRTRKAAPAPKPYPRPGQKDKNTQNIGAGALPPDELHEWIRNKAQERRTAHAGNCTGDSNRHSGPAGGPGENNQ